MLVGNKDILDLLSGMDLDNDLTHAYLFVGPNGIGKTVFAHHFAKRLLCENDNSCGKCVQCRILEANNHPDYQLLDDDEHVSVETARELVRFLDLRPFQSKRKVVVIANAERLTTSAANSLLKTLEEPSANSVIILTATNSDNLLPTIKSRTRIVKFNNLKQSDIDGLVFEHREHQNLEKARKLSCGRIGLLKNLLENNEFFEENLSFINEFEQVANSDELFSKIKFAEKIAKQKDNIMDKISLLEGYYREKMIHANSEEILKISHFLDKLTETRNLLKQNVNKQLALESLLFTELK